MAVDSKFSKCTSYLFMISFSYSKCTVMLCPRSLSFDFMNLANFYKCISELWKINKADVFGNPVETVANNISIVSQVDSVWGGSTNRAVLKCVASSAKCNTRARSMHMKSVYSLALNWVFSAPMVTRYRLGAILILWHGTHIDARYSSFSRVFGVMDFVLAVFSRSYSLVGDGWTNCLCNFRSNAMV